MSVLNAALEAGVPGHWSTWSSFGFWKQVLGLQEGLPSQRELQRNANGASLEEQLRIWQLVEDIDGARRLLRLLLLGLLACVPSLVTGVWCYPSFFASVVVSTLPHSWWLSSLLPTNAAVYAVYHVCVAAVRSQDIYQGIVNTICWVIMNTEKRSHTWDGFQASLVCERDWRLLAEKHMAFHKMLTSVFDAWCFCDSAGLIDSSTPQLGALLGSAVALRGISLVDLAASGEEARRVEAFLAGVARGEAAGKLTVSLKPNHTGEIGQEMDVCLTAIALSRSSTRYSLSTSGGHLRSAGTSTEQGEEELMLFVAVQAVTEADTPCASEEVAEGLPVQAFDTDVKFEIDEEPVDMAPTFLKAVEESVADLPCSLPVQRRGVSWPQALQERQVRIKNTFVEAAESEVPSMFEDVPQLSRSLSAPALLQDVPLPAASPSVRSVRSIWSRRSVVSRVSKRTTASRLSPGGQLVSGSWPTRSAASVRSGASRRSAATSKWLSSAASLDSEEPAELALGNVLQERGVVGALHSEVVSLGRALRAREAGLHSLGSELHGQGRCYPCLIQAWWHEGKGNDGCKFGAHCGRCHEPHCEADLKGLRRRVRRLAKQPHARVQTAQ